MYQIVKRDGTFVPFDKDKIIRAINGAMLEVDGQIYEYDTAKDIANDIEKDLIERYSSPLKNSSDLFTITAYVSVENIQDMVEDYLMRSERRDVARAYIRYRYKKLLKSQCARTRRLNPESTSSRYFYICRTSSIHIKPCAWLSTIHLHHSKFIIHIASVE